MKNHHITSTLIIADILERWPQTVSVFLKYRMSCPGCFMASFETLEDALQIYGLAVDPVVNELNQTIKAGTSVKEE